MVSLSESSDTNETRRQEVRRELEAIAPRAMSLPLLAREAETLGTIGSILDVATRLAPIEQTLITSALAGGQVRAMARATPRPHGEGHSHMHAVRPEGDPQPPTEAPKAPNNQGEED